jgi:hypothetical protein
MINYTVVVHVNDWLILIQDTVVLAKAGRSAVCWNQSVCNGHMEIRSYKNLWLVTITAKKMAVFWGCTIKFCQTSDSFDIQANKIRWMAKTAVSNTTSYEMYT